MTLVPSSSSLHRGHGCSDSWVAPPSRVQMQIPVCKQGLTPRPPRRCHCVLTAGPHRVDQELEALIGSTRVLAERVSFPIEEAQEACAHHWLPEISLASGASASGQNMSQTHSISCAAPASLFSHVRYSSRTMNLSSGAHLITKLNQTVYLGRPEMADVSRMADTNKLGARYVSSRSCGQSSAATTEAVHTHPGTPGGGEDETFRNPRLGDPR